MQEKQEEGPLIAGTQVPTPVVPGRKRKTGVHKEPLSLSAVTGKIHCPMRKVPLPVR